MSETVRIWDRVEQPPDWALKTIQAGRLKGKTDINPQWRYRAMTELFGPCGDGWWFTVDKKWLEPAENGEVCAFVDITLYTEDCDKGIPGNGGAKFVANERGGPHVSDEAYKMATTDALSVAMKMLGVAARIYYGAGGTKYSARPGADKKSGTKKQNKKETSEVADKGEAVKAFERAFDSIMDTIGEDDADNITALCRHFLKTATEKSDAYLVMTDNTSGMTSKEVKLLTAMLTKGHAKVEGLCLGDWRTDLGLPGLGVETCSACAELLNEKEKAAWVAVGLTKPYCEAHAGIALTEKMKEAKSET